MNTIWEQWTMKEYYPIEEIFWIDAETLGDTGWMDLTEAVEAANISPPIMRSVGYVLVSNDSWVAITDAVGDKECGHVTKIPVYMIQRRIVLVEADTMGSVG